MTIWPTRVRMSRIVKISPLHAGGLWKESKPSAGVPVPVPPPVPPPRAPILGKYLYTNINISAKECKRDRIGGKKGNRGTVWMMLRFLSCFCGHKS